jgi:hypothetical protein
MNKLTITASLCTFLLFGCDTPGKNGISVSDNTDSEAYSVVMAKSVIVAGENSNCPNGGISIDTGIDTNGNSTLDSNEIVDTYIICNGSDGANLTQLVEISTESDISICPLGGKRIDKGFDLDGDQILDPEEITETIPICSTFDAIKETVTCYFAFPESTNSAYIDSDIAAKYTMNTLYSGAVEVTSEISSESIYTSRTLKWLESQTVEWDKGYINITLDVNPPSSSGRWHFEVARDTDNSVLSVKIDYIDQDHSDPDAPVTYVLTNTTLIGDCNPS